MQRHFHFSGMRAQECHVWVVWWAHVQFCKQLPTLFPSLAVLLRSHQSCVSDLVSPHAHQHLVLSLFFVLAILMSVWSPNSLWFQSTSLWLMVLVSFCVFICHLYALHCKMSIHAFLHCLSCYWCVLRVPSFILRASPLSDTWFAKLSSQSVACLFNLLTGSFAKQTF